MKAEEHGAGGESREFSASMRGLGGEGGRPRVSSNVIGYELEPPTFVGLFNNLLDGRSGERQRHGDRGAGSFVEFAWVLLGR
jgi:hypothetical protein